MRGARDQAGKSLVGSAVTFVTNLLTSWKHAWLLMGGLLAMECVLCGLIITRKAYTKIDWDAYMSEVAPPMDQGDYDYTHLRGETGPLVYPAAFVWLYGALRRFAGGDGSDVRAAQWAFAAVYVGTQALVFLIYARVGSKRVPPYVLVLLCLSKRMHSIYVLRLFNDCWAMLLLYAAVALFAYRRWRLGCVLYSLAVGVKMNIFLFAPALALLMIKEGGWAGAITNIAICAVVQVGIAVPFLLTNFVGW
eukprot:g2245.t1